MINSKILYKSLIFFFFCILKMNAQEVLTIEDALKIALKNNYAIKIAKNTLEIDKSNVAIANAGMLPKITAAIVDNNSIQNSSQTR